MDIECINMLMSIGFEEYIPQFEAALFSDVESIQALGLQPDLLAQVIGPVGHRAKFVSKIGKFIAMQKGQEIAIDIKPQNNEQLLKKIVLDTIVEIDDNATATEVAEILQSESVTEEGTNYAGEEEPPSTSEEVPAKKRRVISNEVLEYLQSTVDGKFLLGLHESKGFDNKRRVRLANCVINAEYGTDTNKVITSIRFKELARQIQEIFPDEEETTYYVPAYTPRGGKTVIAKGKLSDKCTSLNREFREANLRQKRPTQSEDIEPNDLPENIEGNSDIAACRRFIDS